MTVTPRVDAIGLAGDVSRPEVGEGNFASLVELALKLVPADGRAILGITGKPGAGKTTFAMGLVKAIEARQRSEAPSEWVVHVPMDGFHLAHVQLDRLGLRHLKGAPETFDDAGYAAILTRLRLRSDEIMYAPGFERVLEQPIAAAIAVPPHARLVITEGNYLLHDSDQWPRARAQLDQVWYCELDDDTRIARLVARHIAFGKAPDDAEAWVARSDEANARLIGRTRGAADLIVNMATTQLP